MSRAHLSDHCTLLARPGGPTPPRERPADCPKDGAFLKTVEGDPGSTLVYRLSPGGLPS